MPSRTHKGHVTGGHGKICHRDVKDLSFLLRGPFARLISRYSGQHCDDDVGI
jgi:hypothetical protein